MSFNAVNCRCLNVKRLFFVKYPPKGSSLTFSGAVCGLGHSCKSILHRHSILDLKLHVDFVAPASTNKRCCQPAPIQIFKVRTAINPESLSLATSGDTCPAVFYP